MNLFLFSLLSFVLLRSRPARETVSKPIGEIFHFCGKESTSSRDVFEVALAPASSAPRLTFCARTHETGFGMNCKELATAKYVL